MTMYGIIGAGTVTATVLNSMLDQLDEIPRDEDEEFYFTVAHGIDDKVATAFSKWATKSETYYDVKWKGRSTPDDALTNAADEKAKVPNPISTVLEEVKEVGGKLLVLWEEDNDEITAAVREALANDIEVLDLTDALTPVEFDPEAGDDEDETASDPEPEPEPEAPAPPRTRSKKTPAAPPPPAPRKRGRKPASEKAEAAAETEADGAVESPEVIEGAALNGESGVTALDAAVGRLVRAVADVLAAAGK